MADNVLNPDYGTIGSLVPWHIYRRSYTAGVILGQVRLLFGFIDYMRSGLLGQGLSIRVTDPLRFVHKALVF